MGGHNIESVQWVNRYKLNNLKEHIIHNKKISGEITAEIKMLKRLKKIKSFYFFPYCKINNVSKIFPNLNGLTCYRNIKSREYDSLSIKNNLKIIAIRALGNFKKIKAKDYKRLILFNLKSKLVKKIIIGANNKEQLDALIRIC